MNIVLELTAHLDSPPYLCSTSAKLVEVPFSQSHSLVPDPGLRSFLILELELDRRIIAQNFRVCENLEIPQ